MAAATFLAIGCQSAEKKPDAPLTAEAEKKETSAAKKEGLLVDKTPEEVGLPRTGPLFFEYDSDTLDERSQKQLTEIASYLQSEKAARITIEGHADKRGSSEYNLALGDKRALAAKDFLARLGVPKDRIGIVSYGEEKPAVDGDDEESLSQNRRDEFRFILQ